MSDVAWDRLTKAVPIAVAILALFATTLNVVVAHWSYKLNAETQKTALFSQFQNEYNSIAARFPEKLLDKSFAPPRGSAEYKKLQDYWIFCYAEWYQTQKVGKDTYGELWQNYYSGLISNALEVPSLRYVIQDMMKTYGVKQKSMQDFYADLRDLAIRTGQPLRIE